MVSCLCANCFSTKHHLVGIHCQTTQGPFLGSLLRWALLPTGYTAGSAAVVGRDRICFINYLYVPQTRSLAEPPLTHTPVQEVHRYLASGVRSLGPVHCGRAVKIPSYGMPGFLYVLSNCCSCVSTDCRMPTCITSLTTGMGIPFIWN